MTEHYQGDSAQITTFEFEQQAVRTVYEDGKVWFVGKDVAEALGYSDTVNALKQHCRGVVKHHPIVDSLGRIQEARIISEPDMFRLMVNSHLPAAERFERWVFEDVLPTLRKTGSYIMPGKKPRPDYAGQRHSWRLMDKLKVETHPVVRKTLWEQLNVVLLAQGIETPPMSAIGKNDPGEPPIVGRFWDLVAVLGAAGYPMNHSRDPELIAINPNLLLDAAHACGINAMSRKDLLRAMRASRRPRFLSPGTVVNSGLTEKSVRCWLFKNEERAPQAWGESSSGTSESDDQGAVFQGAADHHTGGSHD
jgi:prophage antirepressor-like protein